MRFPLIGLTLLLGACVAGGSADSASVDIDFDVEPDEVAPGDSITLELENDTRGAVSYNLCASTLQMESGSDWSDIPSDRACTRELRVLGPDEEVRFRLQLPADLAEGHYRFTTGVQVEEGGGGGMQVPSETFRVRG